MPQKLKPVKSKKEETKHDEAVAVGDEGKPKEQPTRTILQVVEVIEEGIPESNQISKTTPKEKESDQDEMIGETSEYKVETNDEKTPDSESEKRDEPESASDEKMQKSVVEELFKKPESQVGPEISVHRRKSSMTNILIWGIVVVAIALGIGGGLMLFQGGKTTLPTITFLETPTPVPTGVPTAVPTPTPDATLLKREDLKIQVLNGGGTPGAASKMKKLLTDKGYKVTATGNTDNYSYEKTEISVKAEKEAFLALLASDLKDTYELGNTDATLSASGSYDAVIIVGK